MPVNDDYQPDEPAPIVEQFLQRSRRAVGATDRIPFRVMLLFAVVAVCVALAPIPANLVGVAAIALLTLDTSLHRR